MKQLNERMCIVTREKLAADQLIRFVLAPDGALIPDIKQKLPGRGCWVTAQATYIDQAQKNGLFARSLKTKIEIPGSLSQLVDELMSKSTLGMINMARKAGQFITGSSKVDHAVRNGEALASFHTTDAADDGVRKLNQARTFFSKMAEVEIIPSFRLFSNDEMSQAFGEGNYVHGAALAGSAGDNVVKRASILANYRGLDNDKSVVDGV
ncbi:MAG: RNA-binding protein [Rhizobiaceae bacterium]|nr:RNA-binding protein [Rhizobiaceae bacterium]